MSYAYKCYNYHILPMKCICAPERKENMVHFKILASSFMSPAIWLKYWLILNLYIMQIMYKQHKLTLNTVFK